MSLATGARLTADEFLARDDWPRGTQLIEGEVVVNQPALPHQLLLGHCDAHLLAWTRAEPGRGLACLSVDVRVTPANVYGPDVWWVGEERRPPPGQLALDGVGGRAVAGRHLGRQRARLPAVGSPVAQLRRGPGARDR